MDESEKRLQGVNRMVIGARVARRTCTRTLATSGFSIRRFAGVAAAVVVLALIGAPGALAQITDIHSDAGPLTDIYIGDNLTCQVAHTGDAVFEFYSPGSQAGHCETDVSVGSSGNGQVFQPGSWTPVSQSAVTGDGSARNPFVVTTTVRANDASSGSPLLTLTETDSYVIGNEYYRTDITLANATGRAACRSRCTTRLTATCRDRTPATGSWTQRTMRSRAPRTPMTRRLR